MTLSYFGKAQFNSKKSYDNSNRKQVAGVTLTFGGIGFIASGIADHTGGYAGQPKVYMKATIGGVLTISGLITLIASKKNW